MVTARLVWIQQHFIYLGSANQPSHCESAGRPRGPPSSLAMLNVPKANLTLLGLRKAADHSHSGLGFMGHWQLSRSACGIPSIKSIQTHHFDLSVLKKIHLINFVLRSCTLAQVSAVVPSASTKPHPQHMLHIMRFVKSNSNVRTRTCTHLSWTCSYGGALQCWAAAVLVTSGAQAATHGL